MCLKNHRDTKVHKHIDIALKLRQMPLWSLLFTLEVFGCELDIVAAWCGCRIDGHAKWKGLLSLLSHGNICSRWLNK